MKVMKFDAVDAEREISNLVQIPSHPNLVQYFPVGKIPLVLKTSQRSGNVLEMKILVTITSCNSNYTYLKLVQLLLNK